MPGSTADNIERAIKSVIELNQEYHGMEKLAKYWEGLDNWDNAELCWDRVVDLRDQAGKIIGFTDEGHRAWRQGCADRLQSIRDWRRTQPQPQPQPQSQPQNPNQTQNNPLSKSSKSTQDVQAKHECKGGKGPGGKENKCLMGSSRVLMGDGTLMRCDEITKGMHVLQPDPLNPCELQVQEVLDVRVKTAKSYIIVILESGRCLMCTVDHPFWNPERRVWMTVDGFGEHQLSLGSEVLCRGADCPTATTSVVSKILYMSDVAVPVYSLTVSGYHCHFAEGILVHNGCHQWNLSHTLLCTAAGAVAGGLVGWGAQNIAQQLTTDTVKIEMTSHASGFVSGGAAGALLGSAIFPGAGTILGACAGAVGGLLANKTRLVFYPIVNPESKQQVKDSSGNIVHLAYMADDDEPHKPESYFGTVDNPCWHPALSTALVGLLQTGAGIAAKVAAKEISEEAVKMAAKKAGKEAFKTAYKETFRATAKEVGKEAARDTAKAAAKAASKAAAVESLELAAKATPGIGLAFGIGSACWRWGSSTYQFSTGQMSGAMYAGQAGLGAAELGSGIASCFLGQAQ